MTEMLVNVSLRAWHPSIPAADIAEAFGLPVEVSQSVGAPKVAPNGRAIGGVGEETYVSMSLVRKQQVELGEALVACHESIRHQAVFIRMLVDTGGEVELYVSAFLAESCGFNLDGAFFVRFAEAGLSLSVELYPEAVP